MEQEAHEVVPHLRVSPYTHKTGCVYLSLGCEIFFSESQVQATRLCFQLVFETLILQESQEFKFFQLTFLECLSHLSLHRVRLTDITLQSSAFSFMYNRPKVLTWQAVEYKNLKRCKHWCNTNSYALQLPVIPSLVLTGNVQINRSIYCATCDW